MATQSNNSQQLTLFQFDPISGTQDKVVFSKKTSNILLKKDIEDLYREVKKTLLLNNGEYGEQIKNTLLGAFYRRWIKTYGKPYLYTCLKNAKIFELGNNYAQ